MSRHLDSPRERGATMIMVAFSLMVLLGVSAIAIDLSAMRTDRSADQKVTDSASASGALATVDGAGQEACEAALAYVALNAQGVGSIDTSGCATSFSATCIPSRAETHTVTDGRHTITITYPVPDDHFLMTSGILGAPGQDLVESDGTPCQRVGVEMEATHSSLFAQLLGFDQGTTTVHTVATASVPRGGGVPINLLVLDRTGCQSISSSGNGGIIVNAVVDEDGTGLIQGIIAADSDGSAGCMSDGVIDINGSNALVRADGPDGCVGQVGTGTVGGFTSGHGCGLVQVFAPGTPGCNAPACTPGPLNPPRPEPTPLPGRLTRAPVDHRYNCYGDYTSPPTGPSVAWAVDPLTTANGQGIPGCTEGTPAHIYNLIQFVGHGMTGTPTGFVNWTSLGPEYTCDLTSGTALTYTGNVRINCSTFTVRREVRIVGNVVFDGNVSVTSSNGHLNVQNTLGSPGWGFFRGGTLTKDGQAHLTFNFTTVYMSKTSRVAMSGGGGSLTWVAPNNGNFDDLALWSDSPLVHNWAGQANLRMVGVFFMPWARADYSGTSGQNQTEAQWIAHSLEARGQGRLVVQPAFGRAILFPVQARTTLIR